MKEIIYKKVDKNPYLKFYNEFYRQITIQAGKVKSRFKNIPLETEDLINITIFELPNIISAFDEKKNVGIQAYVSIKTFYFMLNYARRYTTKNFQVMNYYVDFDYMRNFNWTQDVQPSKEIKPISIKCLSLFEKKVYNQIFLKNSSTLDTACKFNKTEKSIWNATCRIRRKLRAEHK